MCKTVESDPSLEGVREYIELVRDVNTEEDLGDLHDYFQFFYGDEIREKANEIATAENGEGKQKRALRRDLYATAKRHNIGEFAKVLHNSYHNYYYSLLSGY